MCVSVCLRISRHAHVPASVLVFWFGFFFLFFCISLFSFKLSFITLESTGQ